jgi:hypothetical protein
MISAPRTIKGKWCALKESSMEQVMDIVDTDKSILFTVSSRFNSHLNLLLLRHLVKDRGLKGVYLTVDRPSDIMKRLLAAKKIDGDKVIFLDPVSRVSGLPAPPVDHQVKFMDNPFFGEVMSNLSDEGHQALKDEGVSFVMIDNVSALSCYVDIGTIRSMLMALGRWKELTVLMCADDVNLRVQNGIRDVCTNEVEFNEHMVPTIKR